MKDSELNQNLVCKISNKNLHDEMMWLKLHTVYSSRKFQKQDFVYTVISLWFAQKM